MARRSSRRRFRLSEFWSPVEQVNGRSQWNQCGGAGEFRRSQRGPLSFGRARTSAGRDCSSGTVVAVSRTPDPFADVLADPRDRARAEASRHPEVEAVVGWSIGGRDSPAGWWGSAPTS
jgi:hypothetical protein